MNDLKACLVCFSTDVKLFSINSGHLRREFQLISGIQIAHGSGLPDHLCFQCSAIVRKFKRFRDRCHRAHYALKEILNKNKEINISILNNVDRNILDNMPPLSIMDLNKSHYEQVKFQWKKHNCIERFSSTKDNILIAHRSTLTPDNTFDGSTNENTELEFSEQNIKIDPDSTLLHEELHIKLEPNINESMDLMSETPDSFLDKDNLYSDNNTDLDEPKLSNLSCEMENIENVDELNIDEEYATMIPISFKEAKAAISMFKMFNRGKYHCKICNNTYNNKEHLKVHFRMHDKNVSGSYHCGLCHCYYKTQILLKTHVTEKHLFKYLCTKCSEVSFDRSLAKKHYIGAHLKKLSHMMCQTSPDSEIPDSSLKNGNFDSDNDADLDEPELSNLSCKIENTENIDGFNMDKEYATVIPISAKEAKAAFEVCKTFSCGEYHCKLCNMSYNNEEHLQVHLRIHNKHISGSYHCGLCQYYYKTEFLLKTHMTEKHLFKYLCRKCSEVSFDRYSAKEHYSLAHFKKVYK